MGKGEFLTNKQTQEKIRAGLALKQGTQLPTPSISQAAEAIINETKADYEKAFGKPAPDLSPLEEPYRYKTTPPVGGKKNTVILSTHEGVEEEERLANELTRRLNEANFDAFTSEIPKPTPPPQPTRSLAGDEEIQAQRDFEDHRDKAYGEQASRNGPM